MSHTSYTSQNLDETLSNLLADLQRANHSDHSNDNAIVQVETLISYLAALQDAIKRRSAALAKHRNGFLPVNKLPSELLTDIILTRLRYCPPKSRHQALGKLALVQSRWWQNIAGCASFWTDVDIQDSPLLLLAKIERSKNAPFRVSIEGSCTQEKVEAFVRAVGPHAHRWRSVSYKRTELGNTLNEYLERPLPQLEMLQVESSLTDQMSIEFIGGPNLHTLALCGISLSDWARIKNLSALSLVGINVTHHFTPSLLTVLASSPALATLQLQGIDMTGPPLEDIQPMPIVLHHLTVLDLYEIPHSLMLHLVRTLRAELVRDLQIVHYDSGEILAELTRPEPDHPLMLETVYHQAELESIDVEIKGSIVSIEGKRRFQQEVSVELPFSISNPTPVLPFVDVSPPRNLCLTCRAQPSAEGPHPTFPRLALDLFPNLSELRLECTDPNVENFIALLTSPSEDGALTCPNIRVLRLISNPMEMHKWAHSRRGEVVARLAGLLERRCDLEVSVTPADEGEEDSEGVQAATNPSFASLSESPYGE